MKITETNLEGHDIALPIGSFLQYPQRTSRATSQEPKERTFRFLLLTPRDILPQTGLIAGDDGRAETTAVASMEVDEHLQSKIVRFMALTGGEDVVVIFLLVEDGGKDDAGVDVDGGAAGGSKCDAHGQKDGHGDSSDRRGDGRGMHALMMLQVW